jgi:uncharacterized protein YndB with AHSA1/START domain
MSDALTATASITIDASPDEVWHALTDPGTIERYYFGTTVETDWQVGSPITWSGEYEGTAYRDHGVILEVRQGRLLRHTHFSPLSGDDDIPANHHTLTYTLVPDGAATKLTLTQDNNADTAAVEHSQANWATVLEGLRTVVDG